MSFMEGWPSPVDGNSLENCQGGNLLASSNLAPSANTKTKAPALVLLYLRERREIRKVATGSPLGP
jgi:hypothetical protein